MCGDKDCKFEEQIAKVKNVQNLIFNPNHSVKFRELIHVLLAGVRIINIDLAFGTYQELQNLFKNLIWAIKIFLSESKFYYRITKVCTIRGRVQRTGRMRNCCDWFLDHRDEIVLTCDKRYQSCSTNEVCYVSNFTRFMSAIKADDIIKIGSDLVLQVKKIALNNFVPCSVVVGGCLSAYQEVKLPQFNEKSFEPTEEEREDCELAKANECDFIIVPSVKYPEQFHVISGLTRKSEIKLIAQVHTALGDKEIINRIIAHYYGIFVDESSAGSDAYIMRQARNSKKLLMTRQGMEQVLESTDCQLMHPSKCAYSVIKTSLQCAHHLESNNYNRSLQFNDADTLMIEKTLKMSQKPEAKAIVSLTLRRQTVEKIAFARPGCQIILLTKCPTIAKRLQMWRNVHAMVYVDCENKAWKEQRSEMMQIAGLYGVEMEMFGTELQLICCYSAQDSNPVPVIDDKIHESIE